MSEDEMIRAAVALAVGVPLAVIVGLAVGAALSKVLEWLEL